MATATRRRKPSAPAERLVAEVLAAQGRFFDAARRPSEEFLAQAIELPPGFDPLDAETIRSAQLAYQEAFQQRSAERLRLGLRRAMAQPTRLTLIRDLRARQRASTDPDVKVRLEQEIERRRREPDPRRQAVTGLLEQERRLAGAHAAAMAGRARGANRSTEVRALSPTGAFWRRNPMANSCKVCRFMDGKLWPWEVLDRISPPQHPNCQCGLYTVAVARFNGWIDQDKRVPSAKQAIHRARNYLMESIEGAILVEAVDRGLYREPLVEDFSARQWRDWRGRWRDMPASVGRRLELKPPMEGRSFAAVGDRKKLTKSQVHARTKQVVKAFVDFYGVDEPPEVRREDEYLAANDTAARFRHKGEAVEGLLYGHQVARDAADPDLGVHPFRMIAHEAAHSLSGVRPGPLPGFSQTVEEGGAEVLSLWFWKHRGQEMDHRDASRVEGKWTEGVQTLAHSSAYREWTAEVIRRAASQVGWEREDIVDRVEAAMRGDHYERLEFRDESREDFPVPEGVTDMPEGIIEWLLTDPPPALKGDWSRSPTAEAEVHQTIGALVARYPIPFRHVEVADWVDEINQYAGKSNDTIHVSPKFLDDENAAAREREWHGISKAGEFGRPGTIVHEFGHVIHGHLLGNDRAAHDEIDAFLEEPVELFGQQVPRLQSGLEAPSPYGAENRYEFVAEAFTDWYFNGEDAHPSSVAIGRIIDRALRAPVQEDWSLSPVALARKAARQKRDRVGRFADEGLHPTLGRRAPGWMDRDIGLLRERLDAAREFYPRRNFSPSTLREIGAEVDKVALRYSYSRQLRDELEANRERRRNLMDKGWDAFEAQSGLANLPRNESSSLTSYLPDEESEEYKTLMARALEIDQDLESADAKAYLGVLRKLRPMGGQPKIGNVNTREEQFSQDELADIDERFADALVEVGEVLPTEWVDDLNAKGQTDILFSTDRAWCSTSEDREGEPDPWEAARDEFARLGQEGYEFLGTHRDYDKFLMFRRPDGDVIALNSNGQIASGVGAFADTPVVLGADGEFNLPEFAERPDDPMEFIVPRANIPPPRQSHGGAMGAEHDFYERMRAAVERYESEGWTFVGMREPWAVLRKGDEEITLNWAGEPFGERATDPLNPYGQIPLPPLPVRINSEIKIDPQERSTLLHEYGHRIEAAYGREMKTTGQRPLMNSLLQFLAERRKGEKPRKLSEITGNWAYDDHEMAFTDEFVNPYIGKLYGDRATEVLTMGLQGIFYPTSRDRLDDDPDMRHFILGLLAAA